MALRNKWHDDGVDIGVGDVVLIANPDEVRETWKRGVIVALHPGSDGRVRIVSVRYKDGKPKQKSVNNLILLKSVSRRQTGTSGDGVPDC